MPDALPADPGLRLPGAAPHWWRRRTFVWAFAILAAVAIATILHEAAGDNAFSAIGPPGGRGSYAAVFLLVFGDAVFPVLPGETTLNAASTLAAHGSLALSLVITAGALGAIAGDSCLYWLARSNSDRLQPQVDRAKRNRGVASALGFIGDSAPTVLIVGRYVPGMRFIVNATMGINHYPYRRFIVYSSIGGAIWATYTCVLAYAISTALAEFPLASVIIAGLVTTTAIGVIFVMLRRHRAVVVD